IIKKPLPVKQSQSGEVRESRAVEPQEPEWIELELARKHFEEKDAIFIDAREVEEYQEGHIQDAVNVPYGWYWKEHPDLSTLLPEGRVIIIYCSGSDCEASVQLAFAMFERGYSNLKIFFGGWEDWVNAGLPVQEGPQP
ncbi:MAG: rhodanese-like domain-containing protein, partial [Acidobacteriota bacterium]